MKPERINELIAEACGWDCDPAEAREWGSRGQWCKPPNGFQYVWPHAEGSRLSKNAFLPRYNADLNAMHEAERVSFKSGDAWDRYFLCLESVCALEWNDPNTATAMQRAEAFLRTIGKWEVAK